MPNVPRDAAAIVVTDIVSGTQRFVAGADVAGDPLRDMLEAHLRSGKSGMEETRAGPRLSHRPCAAAAARHHRGRAYQPGAGADGAARRL